VAVGSRLRVSDVRLFPGSLRDVADGLLGYLLIELDGGLLLDGITLRRSRAGELTLSYPAKRGPGVEYFYIRPVDAESRREIERQILAALDLEDSAA
jgi:DNA-binding cell septation regulator SpoVG